MAAVRIDPEMYEWCERMETPNLAQEYAIELSLLPNVQELNANPLLQQQQNAAAAAPRGVDRPRNFADDRNVGFALTLSKSVATELSEWSIEEIRAQPIGVALARVSVLTFMEGSSFLIQLSTMALSSLALILSVVPGLVSAFINS
jgi:hypothetical protein